MRMLTRLYVILIRKGRHTRYTYRVLSKSYDFMAL